MTAGLANPMAHALSERRMRVAEFLRWDAGTDTRSELVAGQPVAMAPPSGRHAEIATNILMALNSRLTRPCRALSGAGVARDLEDDECRIPDVFITCERMPEHVFASPRLVVEVLSRSTEKEDRTAKLDFYKSLPSVEAILLVWQDRRRVQLHVREEPRWPAQDFAGAATTLLCEFGVELTLDKICAGIDFPSGRNDNTTNVGQS